MKEGVGFDWSVRVRSLGVSESRAYARNHTIVVGQQASLKESDPHPSAIEYMLAALGADLASGLRREAERAGTALDAVEIALAAELDNALVHLGVIGEEGSARVKSVDATLYVQTDAGEDDVRRLLEASLPRSPLFATLSRSVEIHLKLRVTA
jgi:uncharacterized OsmC-like protein